MGALFARPAAPGEAKGRDPTRRRPAIGDGARGLAAVWGGMVDRDLTSGSLAGRLTAMVGPAALGMLFTTLYNIVDTDYAG